MSSAIIRQSTRRWMSRFAAAPPTAARPLHGVRACKPPITSGSPARPAQRLAAAHAHWLPSVATRAQPQRLLLARASVDAGIHGSDMGAEAVPGARQAPVKVVNCVASCGQLLICRYWHARMLTPSLSEMDARLLAHAGRLAAGTLVEARQSASIADLLRFTLPTLGIWLIGPILSLADTAFVGSHVRILLHLLDSHADFRCERCTKLTRI